MSRRDGILVNRTLYQVGVVTVVASIFWVGVGIYGALTNPLAVEVDKNILTPLPPAIDKAVVEEIVQRMKVELATNSATQDDTIIVDQEDELTN